MLNAHGTVGGAVSWAAATAAANELSSVDGDEPINPIGSTVELTRLAVRPILTNLRPRKLWRNIRRKKQD